MCLFTKLSVSLSLSVCILLTLGTHGTHVHDTCDTHYTCDTSYDTYDAYGTHDTHTHDTYDTSYAFATYLTGGSKGGSSQGGFSNLCFSPRAIATH